MSKMPNPVDVHVGGRVRLRRMQLGMSQQKLGEHLQLTFQQIQKYEKGTNRISSSRLFDLSRVLDVPVRFFFDEVPTDSGAPAVPDMAPPESDEGIFHFLSSRDGLELNRAFLQIKDAKVRSKLVNLVRVLASDVPSERTG